MTHPQSRGRLRHVATVLAVPLMIASLVAGARSAAATTAACQNWTGAQPPSPGTVSNELLGAAVLSSCDAWAVGDDVDGNGGRQTLTEHWNGSSWTVTPSPDPGSPDNALTSVRAVSASDVWAVGYYTDSGADNKTLILHWNGSHWKQVPSPDPGGTGSDNDLFSVTATSRSNAWAVGEVFTSGKITTLIVRWNGR